VIHNTQWINTRDWHSVKPQQVALIKQTISKEVAVMSLRTWLPLQSPSWYQEESWDQAPEKLFSSSLALQNARNTPWGRAQLFSVDHTRNNDSARWCTSFGNTFQERHDLCEAETVCLRYDKTRYSWRISMKIQRKMWGIILVCSIGFENYKL
jgi:hypothetical protein